MAFFFLSAALEWGCSQTQLSVYAEYLECVCHASVTAHTNQERLTNPVSLTWPANLPWATAGGVFILRSSPSLHRAVSSAPMAKREIS